MQMSLNSLHSSRSFHYLTKKDFVKAFGSEDSVLVTKDFMKVNFNFETHMQNVPSVHILGEVLKPIQMKLVNSNEKMNGDADLLFCLDENVDDEDSAKVKKSPEATAIRKSFSSRAKNLNIFRRRLKAKTFLELNEEERSKMASIVLNRNLTKDKSKFKQINDLQLLHPSDYSEPDFISITQPIDTDYQPNYSQEVPSITDLFDIDSEDAEYEILDTDYYEMEYLEDE